MAKPKLTVLDLFSGCGGFSYGMQQAGLKIVGAIDFDAKAVEVYNANFEDHKAIQADLTTYGPDDFERNTGVKMVDIIVGGPPCQGFSHVRQVDGANHGPRLIADPRRNLYKAFLGFVAHYRPRVFVMENVLGIRSSEGGRYYQAIHDEAQALGYTVLPEILQASDFGVPQMRRRQFFIGTKRPEQGMRILSEIEKRKRTPVGLWDAIGDLPALEIGEIADQYDMKRRQQQLAKLRKRGREWYLEEVLEIELSEGLTAHDSRPHSARDVRDFKLIPAGSNGGQVERGGVTLEYPYKRGRFTDLYKRQPFDGLCSTILAHMAKDGLMFIHPEQDRTLTPREAARVQGFPDSFDFPVARTHQFRLIGNAVAPPVAKVVGGAIVAQLARKAKNILNAREAVS